MLRIGDSRLEMMASIISSDSSSHDRSASSELGPDQPLPFLRVENLTRRCCMRTRSDNLATGKPRRRRHLDIVLFTTWIEACATRMNCARHGVKQLRVPRGPARFEVHCAL